jgi:hypothetical protein
MSAISPYCLEPGEALATARWIDATLANARKAMERQDHGYAEYLIGGCQRVLSAMRDHGAEHGYSVDILMADSIAALERK